MYSFIKPGLFLLDPERAHAWSLAMLQYLPSSCCPRPKSHPVTVMGLHFSHRIGLAAGFDKSGEHLDVLAKLGFASIEVGTVTAKPQMGNPKPRLFRLPSAQALINRMGFNNPGVDVLVSNIQRSCYQGIIGVNIGKSKETPLDLAVEDYRYCLQKVYAHADYVAINISSPNTPDLRRLQNEGYFVYLIQQLRAEQLHLADQHARYVPLLVKVSPDESDETLKMMAEAMLTTGIDGIIATNTTCSRETVMGVAHAEETGGLSGQPVFRRSTDCLKTLKTIVGDAMTLIAVGGIDSVATAEEKLAAGASLLQVYTGLIYRGPELVARLSDAALTL